MCARVCAGARIMFSPHCRTSERSEQSRLTPTESVGLAVHFANIAKVNGGVGR